MCSLIQFIFRQLLSYSGEWIYSIRSNLRKSSKTDSEVFDEPLPASSSVQSMNLFIYS